MPLPVAHGLLGVSVVAALRHPSQSDRWRPLLAGAFLAICPDFDYALNWLRISGGGWHHGFTHSILFALILGLVTAALSGERKVRNAILFSAATASHALLDYLMTESRGVALWWPFTDGRYRLRLINPINYTWSDATVWEAALGVLRISLVELVIFAPIPLTVVLAQRLWVERSAAAGGKA
jgi:membrane-bound metal-dependent hydrolase YbcI (DUF457 family)